MSDFTFHQPLMLSYDELKQLNSEARRKDEEGVSDEELRDFYIEYLKKEKKITGITVGFTDIEGRFHMLDYDKEFLLSSCDNLTFDGSSINGFSDVQESDLILEIDWSSFRWLPADIFFQTSVIVFGLILNRDGEPYESDMRGRLKQLSKELRNEKDLVVNIAVESEGFLFQGVNAEQKFNSRVGFELVSQGGYFHSLPNDPLKVFMDTLADAKRTLGFCNEKDHPEVAPSQFELNYRYASSKIAADQTQLYKLLARQVAANMGFTASFLPKPIAGINGNGMHTNISIFQNGTNIFYDPNGKHNLSEIAWNFVHRILGRANELCLVMNSSVNSYRRLDPAYEAPNQIKASSVDRTSMIRIPLANKKSARIEVRTISPDANPYMLFYSLLKTNIESSQEGTNLEGKTLPDNIYDALEYFKSSSYMKDLLGQSVHSKYSKRKTASANRCPRNLGNMVKTEEILFHHDVTNQYIWSKF